MRYEITNILGLKAIHAAEVGTSQTPDSRFWMNEPMRQWFVLYSILSKSWKSAFWKSKDFQSLTEASELTESSMLSLGWCASCQTTSLWEEKTPTQ